MMVYPTPLEDRVKLTFTGNKWDILIEFLINCEREMEQIGNDINYTEKINFVLATSRIQLHSGILSYVIILRLKISNFMILLKIGIGTSIRNVRSVSYTHLDVYKRQLLLQSVS